MIEITITDDKRPFLEMANSRIQSPLSGSGQMISRAFQDNLLA
ncbi:hypothetical protein ACFOG5_01085 [Pedobacter fastidiosus]